MKQAPKVLIIGGGIASFVAGIELREKIPNAEITILSAANESMLGGQLASWDVDEFPIEHGLHALFGFYNHILPILKKVGADKNFTKSAKRTFVYERGKIHRFNLQTWLTTYNGFTAKEKLQLAKCIPSLLKLVAKVETQGLAVFDEFDTMDLREFARNFGIPESVIQSNFFRQFYDAAFNEPHELSASVGLEAIYKIFSKPWHYYFNAPSREALIEPLRKYFIEKCRGQLVLNHKLIRILHETGAPEIKSLEIQNLLTLKTEQHKADYYILALGLEDFKQVSLDGGLAELPYFSNIHKLTTVSSVSIQAWFRNDPVPMEIDSLVCGLPEPFSILCPISRVRSVESRSIHGYKHELIATGPETGFETISDEELKTHFFDTLRRTGFSLPENPEDIHCVLRRNRDPLHRYLLTLPGQLALRPEIKSPLNNLTLAGSWVRNSFALPCVDAAAESAISAATLIANQESNSSSLLTRRKQKFLGMPKCAPLVMPPPYLFPKSSAVLFLVDGQEEMIHNSIPNGLQLARGLGHQLLFAALRHENVHSPHDPSGAQYSYDEIMLAAFVREPGTLNNFSIGLAPLALFVNDDAAMAAGREVYGFPKKMAAIQLTKSGAKISRPGLSPGQMPGPASMIRLMNAVWKRPKIQKNTQRSSEWIQQLFEQVPSLPRKFINQFATARFYNHRDFMYPIAGADASSCLQETTCAPIQQLKIDLIQQRSNLVLKLKPSQNDPLTGLFSPSIKTELTLTSQHGVYLEFQFSLGTAERLEPSTIRS